MILSRRLVLHASALTLLLAVAWTGPVAAQAYDTSIDEVAPELARAVPSIEQSASSGEAAAPVTGVVGSYEVCSGAGPASHVAPIVAAGGEPVALSELSTSTLSEIDVLFVTNCSNAGYAGAFVDALPAVEAFVSNGGVLILHDRHVTAAATILPGGGDFAFTRSFSSRVDVRDGATIVTDGPGGLITNSTLDGGNWSTHGYALDESLPADAALILSMSNPVRIVTFSYPYAGGHVVYSTIPLDWFLASPGTHAGLGVIYPTNVVAYGLYLAASSEPDLPPVADAGADQTAECGGLVTLDGSGSSDPAGHPLSYTWTDASGGVLAEGVSPSIELPLGTHAITLTVTNALGLSDDDVVEVVVQDTTPPQLSVSPDAIVLWPANNTLHTIGLDGRVAAFDVCDAGVSAAEVVILEVASDEPPSGTGGNGEGRQDILIAGDCRSADLRASRLGGGSGRVYTVRVSVTDASGNQAVDELEVHVPQNPNRPVVRDADAYSVASACAPPGAAGPQHASVGQDDPDDFRLEAAFPNPVGTSATIRYALPEPGWARITVYDLTGRAVARLVDDHHPAGWHEVALDGSALASGVYLYRLEASGGTATRTLVLAR